MATGPSYLVLVVKLANRDSDYFSRLIHQTLGSSGAQKPLFRQLATAVSTVMASLSSGAHPGNVWATVLNDAGTKSSGTIACVQANASGDTVTFTMGTKTIVLTEAVDFLRGATNTTCGDNLAAAINAHPILKDLFTAVALTGTVTLTSKLPTNIPQSIVMTTSDATAFTLVQVASGTYGAAQFFLRSFTAGANP
jgi:hypothetical protein